MNRSDRFWFRFSRDSARKYPRTTCAPYRHSIPVRCRVDARPVAAPRDARRPSTRRDRSRTVPVGRLEIGAIGSGGRERANASRWARARAVPPRPKPSRRRRTRVPEIFERGVSFFGGGSSARAPVNWYRAPVDWYRVSGDPQPGVADRIRTKTARGRRFAPRSVPSVTDCTIERPIDESL